MCSFKERGRFDFNPCAYVHAFIPDTGYILYEESEHHYVVFDGRQNKVVQKFWMYCEIHPKQVAWLHDIQTFMIYCYNGSVYKLVMGKSKAKRIFTPDSFRNSHAKLSTSGEYILTSPDKKLWSSRTSRLVCTLQGSPAHIECFEFNCDMTRMFTYVCRSTSIQVWEVPLGKLITTYDLDEGAYSMISSSNGLLALRSSSCITLVDSNTGAVRAKFTTSPAYWMQFSPNGKYLFTTHPNTTMICMWDVNNGKCMQQLIGPCSKLVVTNVALVVLSYKDVILLEYWEQNTSAFTLYLSSRLRFFDGDLGIVRRIRSLFKS